MRAHLLKSFDLEPISGEEPRRDKLARVGGELASASLQHESPVVGDQRHLSARSMTVSPDQAWSVAGPTPPPKPPAPGTVPDPLSDEMKAGKWNPQTEDAQKSLIEAFKKEYNLNCGLSSIGV